MKALLVVANSEWRRSSNPHRAVAAGFKRLGYQVDTVVPGDWPVVNYTPDVVFIWNGAKGRRSGIVKGFRNLGVPVFIMEHGFFDRMRYTQIDHAGFNHNASWAGEFDDEGGSERLGKVFPHRSPMRIRKSGKVVVLCQVPDDAQLADSELKCPRELVEHVLESADGVVDVEYRPHPLYPFNTGRKVPQSQGPLKQVIDVARFVITINSNSANEALGWGCPVLCLGPALYAKAGAALQTDVAGLGKNIARMFGGCRPAQETVDRYLMTLANRQWSNDELAGGEVLQKIMDNYWNNRERKDEI